MSSDVHPRLRLTTFLIPEVFSWVQEETRRSGLTMSAQIANIVTRAMHAAKRSNVAATEEEKK